MPSVIDYHDIEDALEHFEYAHLPENLQQVSSRFHALAHQLAATLPVSHQLHLSLEHLLIAKDAAVRAARAQRRSLSSQQPDAESNAKSHLASDMRGVVDEAPSAAETMIADQPRNVVHPVDVEPLGRVSDPLKAMSLCSTPAPNQTGPYTVYCVLPSSHHGQHSDFANLSNGRATSGPGALRW